MTDSGRDDLDQLLRRAAGFAERDADDRWQVVAELHRRTDRLAFEAACRFAVAGDSSERVLGLDVLGQIGYLADRPFLEETLPILVAACANDRSDVRAAAIIALGHVGDHRTLPSVLGQAGHDCEDVRYSVAVALPAVAGDPPAAQAVAALIQLSADTDPQVRDWATFGLGSQMDVDGEPVRDALAARLTDEEGDTAGEAMLGLARRGDQRALAPLLAWLADEPGNLIVEAAAELAAIEALPALLRLKHAAGSRTTPARPSSMMRSGPAQPGWKPIRAATWSELSRSANTQPQTRSGLTRPGPPHMLVDRRHHRARTSGEDSDASSIPGVVRRRADRHARRVRLDRRAVGRWSVAGPDVDRLGWPDSDPNADPVAPEGPGAGGDLRRLARHRAVRHPPLDGLSLAAVER
jgi:HEAT repeat protein